MPRESRVARLGRTWRRRLFGLSLDEASFARRGFMPGRDSTRRRLETVGRAFLTGYNAAVASARPDAMPADLAAIVESERGFAYEGAAMAFSILDLLSPLGRKARFPEFVHGAAERHIYMAYVGSGWALARLRRSPERWMARLDSLLRWLVLDGFGFHEGYFHWRRYAIAAAEPPLSRGYGRRAFDHGLGRALWFVACGDASRIRTIVDRFDLSRHPDLWAGVGLACTYAGGVSVREIRDVVRAAGPHHAQLAQGAAFAAKARERAGNPAPHTEAACLVLCGSSAAEAAAVTDDALVGLPADGDVPRYEVWRARIARRFGPAADYPVATLAAGGT